MSFFVYVITREFHSGLLHVCTSRMSTTLTTSQIIHNNPQKCRKRTLTCICLYWWSYLPPSCHTFLITEAKSRRTVVRESDSLKASKSPRFLIPQHCMTGPKWDNATKPVVVGEEWYITFLV